MSSLSGRAWSRVRPFLLYGIDVLKFVVVGNRNPAASRVALMAILPDILIFSCVAPSFAFATNFNFAQQALSALRDQAINQILYDGTPHEKSPRHDRNTKIESKQRHCDFCRAIA